VMRQGAGQSGLPWKGRVLSLPLQHLPATRQQETTQGMSLLGFPAGGGAGAVADGGRLQQGALFALCCSLPPWCFQSEHVCASKGRGQGGTAALGSMPAEPDMPMSSLPLCSCCLATMLPLLLLYS